MVNSLRACDISPYSDERGYLCVKCAQVLSMLADNLKESACAAFLYGSLQGKLEGDQHVLNDWSFLMGSVELWG